MRDWPKNCSSDVCLPGASPVPSSELGPAGRNRFGETGNVQTATGRPAASRRREEFAAGFVLRVQQKTPGTRTMGHRTLRFRVSVRFAYWAIVRNAWIAR